MNIIEVIKTDGTIEKIEMEKQPNLKQVQEWVGGYVERINHYPNRYTLEKLKNTEIAFEECYVNEEGLLENLPYNSEASILCGQDIVGNAVVFKNFKWD